MSCTLPGRTNTRPAAGERLTCTRSLTGIRRCPTCPDLLKPRSLRLWHGPVERGPAWSGGVAGGLGSVWCHLLPSPRRDNVARTALSCVGLGGGAYGCRGLAGGGQGGVPDRGERRGIGQVQGGHLLDPHRGSRRGGGRVS